MTQTTDPRDPVLAAQGVGKTFGGLRALDGISFALQAGELLGIIGPNGAGKSTLINAVTGLFAPTDGSIVLDGRDITGKPLAACSESGLLRSFQNARVFGTLSVHDSLKLAVTAPRPRSMGVGQAEVDETIADFGLGPFANHISSTLPYGAKKVLNLALVSLCRPKVLFLDEPFAGVDTEDITRLGAIIEQFKAEGVAVAAVEHNIGALLRLAERVLVLDSGRAIFEGSPDETRHSETVAIAYLGQGAAADRAKK